LNGLITHQRCPRYAIALARRPSAALKEMQKEFGFTVETVVDTAKEPVAK